MNLAYEVTTALGPPLVVRIAQRGGRHFEAERAVLDALVTHGLPVPRVLALDHVGEGAGTVSVLVTSKLPGRPMGEREQMEPDATDETIIELGRLLARIHRATLETSVSEHPGWLAGRLDDVGWMYQGGALAGIETRLIDAAAEVVRMCPRPRGPRALVHNDFKAGNILIDAGRVTGILDFEFSSLTDPARDVAFWTFWHGDAAGALLRAGYETGDIALPGIDGRVQLYRVEIALSYLEWFRQRGLWPGAAALVVHNLVEATTAMG